MDTVVHDADEKEHAGRTDTVSDHLEHGAVHAHLPILRIVVGARGCTPHTEAEHDVAHVAHGAVSNHPLEVGLSHGGESTVDHAHDADGTHKVRQLIAGRRTNRVADAQD